MINPVFKAVCKCGSHQQIMAPCIDIAMSRLRKMGWEFRYEDFLMIASCNDCEYRERKASK